MCGEGMGCVWVWRARRYFSDRSVQRKANFRHRGYNICICIWKCICICMCYRLWYTCRTGLAAAARSDDVLREHRRLTQLASYIYCGPTAWRPPPPCSGGPHAWKLPSNVVKPASLNAM